MKSICWHNNYKVIILKVVLSHVSLLLTITHQLACPFPSPCGLGWDRIQVGSAYVIGRTKISIGHVVEWFNTTVLKTVTCSREFESHCVR